MVFFVFPLDCRRRVLSMASHGVCGVCGDEVVRRFYVGLEVKSVDGSATTENNTFLRACAKWTCYNTLVAKTLGSYGGLKNIHNLPYKCEYTLKIKDL